MTAGLRTFLAHLRTPQQINRLASRRERESLRETLRTDLETFMVVMVPKLEPEPTTTMHSQPHEDISAKFIDFARQRRP